MVVAILLCWTPRNHCGFSFFVCTKQELIQLLQMYLYFCTNFLSKPTTSYHVQVNLRIQEVATCHKGNFNDLLPPG